MPTPVFSALPQAGPMEVRRVERELQKIDRFALRDPQHMKVLPWSLEDLAGSLWANIYTGSLDRLEAVTVHRGKPNCTGVDVRQGWRNAGFFLWWYDVLLIDNFVRYDTLTVQQQLEWLSFAVQYHFREQQTAEKNAAQHKQRGDQTNMNVCKRSAKQYGQWAAAIVAEREAFAAQHGIVLTPEILNADLLATAGDGEVQLRLF